MYNQLLLQTIHQVMHSIGVVPTPHIIIVSTCYLLMAILFHPHFFCQRVYPSKTKEPVTTDYNIVSTLSVPITRIQI